MNTTQLAFRLSLIAPWGAIACDADSKSLGDEPPTTAVTTQRVGVLEGGYIQYIDDRNDGSTVAAGFLGTMGLFDSGGVTEALWVGSFTPDGQLAWEMTFPSQGPDRAQLVTGVAAAPDGSTFFSAMGSNGSAVSKIDPDGTLLWSATAPFLDARGTARAVAAMPDGGAIVAGAHTTSGADDIHPWAVRLDDQGHVVASRTWANDDGRISLFETVAVSDDGAILLGGSWGVSQFGGNAWVVAVDSNLDPISETQLPSEDGNNSVLDLRWDEDGNGIAKVEHQNWIVTFSPSAQELSTLETEFRGDTWTPFSSSGHLVGIRSVCGEDDKPGDCAVATIRALDDGATLWEHTFDDYDVMRTFPIDSSEALVALYGPVSSGRHASEIHRLVVE